MPLVFRVRAIRPRDAGQELIHALDLAQPGEPLGLLLQQLVDLRVDEGGFSSLVAVEAKELQIRRQRVNEAVFGAWDVGGLVSMSL